MRRTREEKRLAKLQAEQQRQEALEDALRQDDAERAKQLNFGGGDRPSYYDDCVRAVEHGAANILAATLARQGFDFSTSSDGDRRCALQLLTMANSSPARDALVPVISAANTKTSCGRLAYMDFIKAAAENASSQAQQDAEGYRAVGADMLEENSALSDGVLKIITDWRAEREIICFTAKDPPASSMQVVPFDDSNKKLHDEKRRILDELNHKPRPSKPLIRLNTTHA
jgi:hypothetical protein